MSHRAGSVSLTLAIAGTLWLIYQLFWVWSRATYPAGYVLMEGTRDYFRLILSGFIVAVVIGVEIVVFRWLFKR